MASRFIDFDAARAEREEEPIRLRAFGRDFELPGSMSADLFVHLIRIVEEYGSDADIPVADAVAMLERVLPPAVLDELLAEPDFSQDDFMQLFGLIMEEYGKREGAGEAPAPNRAARRSKTPARSQPRGSRATSPATPVAAAASASHGEPSSSTGD